MMRLTRREFLSLSTATVTGLWLAACQPIQPPIPTAQEAITPLPPLTEVSLLDEKTQATIENSVRYLMTNSQTPGLAVGILQDGQVVYAQGFGIVRAGTDASVTAQSIFQVMDLTHLFTVTAAMQLVEQNKLDLDAPIVEYLPYFKVADERYTQITMRHLLSDSAGLPTTPEEEPTLDWEGKTPQTDDGALERYIRSLSAIELEHAPGTPRPGYMSNMGYDVAGEVIAKVSGEIYEEYMQQHILKPLGMNQSTFYPEQVNPELRVTPHVSEGMEAVVSELVTTSRERAPSVGLFSNLADLLRWAQANMNRGELDGQRILQASSFDEIWKPQAHLGWDFDQQDEGLSWILGSHRGYPVSHYWALDVGFHGSCYLVPQENAGAILLGNQFTANRLTSWYAHAAAKMALESTALKKRAA